MISRRALLAAGLGVLAPPATAQPQSLGAIAANRGILFGAAAATYEFKDADFTPLLAREARIIVPEYEMKRHVVEPQPGVYDFHGIDALLAFASAHGMAMRGHPLVWHAANPPWLEEAVLTRRDETLLTGYVQAVARRYRGRLHSLDVVNEALSPDGSGWRPTFWLKTFGPRYIDIAFHAARAADPQTLLVYNDQGCEQGAPANDAFRAQTLRLLDGLLARGVPVQALGLQSHLSAFGPLVDQRKLRDFLAEITARGLGILVTELDVDDEGGPSDTLLRDRACADEARRFLDVVLDNRQVRTVLSWGLTDRYLDPPQSWRLKLTGWRDRKLPYDDRLGRKPLWGAMAAAFGGEPVKSGFGR